MVSKTVVKVSDWEPEDCNNLTHVIYFLIMRWFVQHGFFWKL